MSESLCFKSRVATGILVGLVGASAALWPGLGSGQPSTAVPDLSANSGTGWLPVGDVNPFNFVVVPIPTAASRISEAMIAAR
jgi:hypothetical protein